MHAPPNSGKIFLSIKKKLRHAEKRQVFKPLSNYYYVKDDSLSVSQARISHLSINCYKIKTECGRCQAEKSDRSTLGSVAGASGAVTASAGPIN
ncbi:unnamed protein product [Arctia plantaginis]|uniref:Uncharacterized protein n=1 Tax=Arctia plantaginis TaxID=874455 RepID=A0A8S1AVR0_ARCPL|nr:unnamed protein product [Arctia plantaginis]